MPKSGSFEANQRPAETPSPDLTSVHGCKASARNTASKGWIEMAQFRPFARSPAFIELLP